MALGLILLLVLLIWRVASVGAPAVSTRRTLATDVRFPGDAPVLSWPRAGQAAVDVEGLGAILSSGALTPVPIASVAKVMTAYLTLREHPLADPRRRTYRTAQHGCPEHDRDRCGDDDEQDVRVAQDGGVAERGQKSSTRSGAGQAREAVVGIEV